jgi:hypothetical protein
LRHAFGVRAVHSGAPLHMVQRWLGHADMKTTAIYAAAVGPEERDIASRTWLREDNKSDKKSVAPDEGLRESLADVVEIAAPVVVMERDNDAEKSAGKPWFRRAASNAVLFCSCHMIHFYLFCNRIFA